MSLIRDILALCAVAAIGGGCWLLHPAAALIVVGMIVLAGLIASPQKKVRNEDDSR